MKKTVKNVPSRGRSMSRRGSVPLADTRVTTAPSSSITIRHRELVTAGISSGTSNAFNLYPQNSLAFPWLSNIAKLYDWWIPNRVSFSYVPSCSLAQSTGSLTCAFDPDVSDEPAEDRQLLFQMSGSQTTQVYKGITISCPAATLHLFPRRFTHYDASVGDARLSSLGNFQYIVDEMPTGNTVVGDLYIDYDITFGAAQPAESTGITFFGPTNVSGQNYFLDEAGMFTQTLADSVNTPGNEYNHGVRFRFVKPTGGSPGKYQIGAVDPGTYTVTVLQVPVSSTISPYCAPVVKETAKDPDVVLWTPDGLGVSDPEGMTTSWHEGVGDLKRAVYTFTFQIKRAANRLRWVVDMFDAARWLFAGESCGFTAAATGLTIGYLAPRQPFLLEGGHVNGAQDEKLSWQGKRMGHMERQSLSCCSSAPSTTCTSSAKAESVCCTESSEQEQKRKGNQLPSTPSKSIPGGDKVNFLTEEERRHFGVPAKK